MTFPIASARAMMEGVASITIQSLRNVTVNSDSIFGFQRGYALGLNTDGFSSGRAARLEAELALV
jgi:hypothetical protein